MAVGLSRYLVISGWLVAAGTHAAGAQQTLAGHIDRASPRMLAAAALTDPAGEQCYTDRTTRRFTDVVGELRLLVEPIPGQLKVRKSYTSAALVAYIVEHGGRGDLTVRLREFQLFSEEVVRQLAQKCSAQLGAAGLNGTGPHPQDWPEYRAFVAYLNTVAIEANQFSAERFAIRYGGGETLNWIEVYFDNLFQRLRLAGATDFRPSHLEPILRLTPLAYYGATDNVISIGEVGANYYFFEGRLKALNPVGLAAVIANPSARRPIGGLFRVNSLEFGIVAHVKKMELGLLRSDAGSWRSIVSANVQLIPGLF